MPAPYHVRELLLTGDDFSRYAFGRERPCLKPLSKVNLFVGANNSGKSRLLRQIAGLPKFTFVPTFDISVYADVKKTLVAGLQGVFDHLQLTDAGNFLQRAKQVFDGSAIVEGEPFAGSLNKLFDDIKSQGTNGFTLQGVSFASNHERVLAHVKEIGNRAEAQLQANQPSHATSYEFKRIYIPTLRGLRTFEDHTDRYEARTKLDYFPSAEHVQIFTGLTLYQDLTKLLLGTHRERESAAEFERFLGSAFFDGQSVALIPKFGQNVLDVKIGRETQRPIFSLGDGIQSLIILTFPLFKFRDANVLLFVEEPELFMHPGLQRLMLEVLMRFPLAQYFLATHSNHLLDLTLDVGEISVFTFRKDLEETNEQEKDAIVTVENVSNEDERCLVLLGIKNSSVFLANCTIWVEGITDRRYFSHYLNLYQQHLDNEAAGAGRKAPRRYQQDLHYTFVEYAGGNITHFSFLDVENDAIIVDRLCGKLFLITDKDAEGNAAKQERHSKLLEKLGARYYCLQCREVENLLAPEVIGSVVQSYEYEGTELKKFTAAAYKNAPLGRFIEEKVLAKERTRGASYQGASGTISDKVTFCQKSLERISVFGDLSEEAKAITILLYQFIEAENP